MMRRLAFVTVCLLVICSAFVYSQDSDCLTPDNRPGFCSPLKECPVLLALLRKQPLPDADRAYLTMSQCGFEGFDPKVCCAFDEEVPPSLTDSPLDANDPFKGHRNRVGLPTSTECGVPRQLPSDLLLDNPEAIIGSYPWTVLLRYTDLASMDLGWRCGGVLISTRYVLTAAHCLRNRNMQPILARLGEHRLSSLSDCQDSECNVPPQDIDIEEVNYHTQFNSTPSFVNDIAILRLRTPAILNNYVRPVCLPFGALALQSPEEETNGRPLFLAGWGTRLVSGIRGDVLNDEALQITQIAQCSNSYNLTLFPATQFCGTRQNLTDTVSCNGDEGGAVTVLVPSGSAQVSVVIGITSVVDGTCPDDAMYRPGLFTHVAPHLRWILDQMRP